MTSDVFVSINNDYSYYGLNVRLIMVAELEVLCMLGIFPSFKLILCVEQLIVCTTFDLICITHCRTFD